jgi:hypothetical protein
MIDLSLMSKFRRSVAGRRAENCVANFQLQTGRLIPLFLLCCFWTAAASAQAWRPAGDNLKTEWAHQVHPDSVLPEYPRPELERVQWQNLNGLWDYAVTDVKALTPPSWQGKILVPFCIESSLSGVQKRFSGANCLWYHRDFIARRAAGGGHLLLHFGACDWRTVVFLNGDLVGSHAGGYDPFTFDLTPFLRDGDTQSLTVQIFDSTDEGEPVTAGDEDKPLPHNESDQPRGKQTLLADDPNYFFHNITYTAASGIWQTVWLEQVPSQYVARLEVHPDLDSGKVDVTAMAQGGAGPVTVAIQSPDGRRMTDGSGPANAPVRLSVPEPQPWSPDHPALYGLEVTFGPDRVRSYFGFRKIERRKDAHGIARFYLNHHPIFLYGPLDQGYWPDGIYTAPTDAALRHDLEVEKRFGFNCVRKHIKVEPARWYYWADHLGLLVWQDFPALSPVLDSAHTLNHPDFERPPAAKAQIETEMHRMVETLSCHPAVIIWTVFNEAWGQYDTQRVTGLFKRWDPTRLVDDASGWNDRRCGDLFDEHDYGPPNKRDGQVPFGKVVGLDPGVVLDRVVVLGEYGGRGISNPGLDAEGFMPHVWKHKELWRYEELKDAAQLKKAFLDGVSRVSDLTRQGLGGAIYTQLTDVEGEVNGLMTYDRGKFKVPPDAVHDQIQAVVREGSAE